MSHLCHLYWGSSDKLAADAREDSPPLAREEQLALLGKQDTTPTFQTKTYTYEPPVDPASM
jgi:hypothetical protein